MRLARQCKKGRDGVGSISIDKLDGFTNAVEKLSQIHKTPS
jgi:hypothetical protein